MEKIVYGCLPAKVDIRNYRINKKAYAANFPESYECEKLVAIKNQGCVGSCVAHSTAEILEHHLGGKHKLSTNFIYGIRKKLGMCEGVGMLLSDACKIVSKYGDPLESLCMGNTEVDEVYSIANAAFVNDDVMQNAAQHKIKSYAYLNNLSDIKYALMTYGPVLGAITWYEDNEVAKDGYLTKGSVYGGGHAIVIYGWNERGLLCQNSWGTRWGNKGYFILPYDYKPVEAYAMMPNEPGEDIIIPTKNCKCLNVVFKIVNWVINLFNNKK